MRTKKKELRPDLEWMLDMRMASRNMVDLLMEFGKGTLVRRIESECQIDHLARDIAMTLNLLNEWIIENGSE